MHDGSRHDKKKKSFYANASVCFSSGTSFPALWSAWMSELPPTDLPPINVFGTVRWPKQYKIHIQ